MKLEEKIALLRKQKGWSQEELAFRLDVSRQSVSKWEMGDSLPDLDKIIKLSDIFGVSTDYLLKDEPKEPVEETPQPAEETEEAESDEVRIREMSDEEAEKVLSSFKKATNGIASGVRLCILSLMAIFIARGLFLQGIIMNKGVANAVGIVGMLLILVWGISDLVRAGISLSEHEYIWSNITIFSPNMEENLRAKYEAIKANFGKRIASGVIRCILSVLPLIVAACIDGEKYIIMYSLAALFLLVSGGVAIFIKTGMPYALYNKLLDKDGATFDGKSVSITINRGDSLWSDIYWSVVVAAYVIVSFWTHRWDRTWIIWPIAIVVDTVVEAIICAVKNKKNNKKDG